ncbi:low molecular weight phosphatase family protein [Microbacterium sp. SORGH_AS_0888]|uniref:arsenate reductase/protein-tyrosine-phosphatase family protein n=1 Tax=Microbacterium sp. SORGH_AS_0888 TaxID=3041791 RepID=UPI002780EB06|nr:low molecular weight phosphatase family protein [Microbacterium sp. SORGH_AS_0888]MDQ1129273.1 protein-tyrosine phosphatase [Microbacterium sp. SORGH_AS_0888]
MFEILTVCTGNVCRSPFAEVVLAAELPGIGVASAGARALIDHPMEHDAARLARQYGISSEAVEAHRARWLTESHLSSPDLVLAMAREHRREVVELAPAKVRSAFTAREFARLAAYVPDAEARRIADAAGEVPRERLRALLASLAGLRSEVEPPLDPAEDDVIDPYRRGWESYELMATQLMPALGEVVRIARIAADRPS